MSGIQTEITLEKLKQIKDELDSLKAQMSPVEPYTAVFTLQYAEATPILSRDNGFVYDRIEIIAPSTNSAVVYVGSSNPSRPLSPGDSVIYRRKKLISFYASGTVGDQLIISA